MKILAVDDDPLILDLLRETMSFAGFNDMTTVNSAVEAAQVIAEARPPFDLLLIDIRMPEIDGDYLCSWIRQLPNYANTPIIMVTALAEKQDVDRAFASGATDYITKPIELSDLIARVKMIARQADRTRKIAAVASSKGHAPKEEGENARVDFMEPMMIGGIRGEIEISALENYLVQISRSGIHEMSAFAFMIRDAAKLHLVSSPKVFRQVLKATALAIAKHMNSNQFFISYTGYGAFAGVIETASIDEDARDRLEKAVRDTLKSIRIPSHGGAALRVEPCMATPRKLGAWSGPKVVDALYRSIGEAEERSKASLLARKSGA